MKEILARTSVMVLGFTNGQMEINILGCLTVVKNMGLEYCSKIIKSMQDNLIKM